MRRAACSRSRRSCSRSKVPWRFGAKRQERINKSRGRPRAERRAAAPEEAAAGARGLGGLERSDKNKSEGESVKDLLDRLVAQVDGSGIHYSEAVREFKKRFIMNVLQQNRGNQCKAARELGMHRNTLSRTISELKLDVRQLRDGGRRPPRSEKPLSLEKQKLVR